MDEPLRPRILAKLDGMTARSHELSAMSADPEVLTKPERMSKIQQELGSLSAVVLRYEKFRDLAQQIADNQSLLEPGGDKELAELAEAELPELQTASKQLADEIIDLLLASDGDNQKSAVVEVRAGAGGDEAALWAGEMFDMYQRYAEAMGWKVEVVEESLAELGGCKECVFTVSGNNVFNFMRFESGGHRVQRVPVTESQGRVHTSLATVAVLAEAEEVDLTINEVDLEWQFVRASGPGGQNVNKVSSAARVTHKPSGLMVFCQEERSQLKNKTKALKLLRTRLYDAEKQKVDQARSDVRRDLVGSGDRSQRIRTYNFPQNRLTDHRIGENYTLDQVLSGRLEPVMNALLAVDREQRIDDL